MLKIFTRYIPN